MSGQQSSDVIASPSARQLKLTIGAIGVVFGDIGTSPLYALRECFEALGSSVPSPVDIIAVLSVIVWSLIIVVTVKYLFFVMRADNRGEGGILALTTLVSPRGADAAQRTFPLFLFGLFGAALLYGDGMITPAISVLSAVEGLKVATSVFDPFVVPIACGILFVLFAFQSRGTSAIAAVFGPLTILWFVCIGLMGLHWIAEAPEVLRAFDPRAAIAFLSGRGMTGFLVLGAVFLVVTGAEALYADMGHFGSRPIRRAWALLVFPALVMNYLGQGSLLILHPEGVSNPFFSMAPQWGLYPLVLLATVATVIASQAVISGAFSLTRQALQLGFFPRVEVRYSSADEMGQVYVPAVNWLLLASSVALVVGFGSSTHLAGAYGVAVTTTMVTTTILTGFCAVRCWRWSPALVVPVAAAFLVVDLAFFGANLPKIAAGGWVPLGVAAAAFIVMTTWAYGVARISEYEARSTLSVDYFLDDLHEHPVTRVPGTAVFMCGNPEGVSRTLLHNIKHNKVIHERNIMLTILYEEIPYVAEEERIEIKRYRPGFLRIIARSGFMETPRTLRILEAAAARGIPFNEGNTTYFFGHDTVIVKSGRGLGAWRAHLFRVLLQNSYRHYLRFGVPSNRVVEIGALVEL